MFVVINFLQILRTSNAGITQAQTPQTQEPNARGCLSPNRLQFENHRWNEINGLHDDICFLISDWLRSLYEVFALSDGNIVRHGALFCNLKMRKKKIVPHAKNESSNLHINIQLNSGQGRATVVTARLRKQHDKSTILFVVCLIGYEVLRSVFGLGLRSYGHFVIFLMTKWLCIPRMH